MRTKTLLLTAALSVAGIASSMAQVYSVNAVGYVNKTIHPGFNLVSNPLIQSNNAINVLIPTPPPLTQVFLFTPGAGGGYSTYTYDPDLGGWDPDPAGASINFGSGAFINNPTTTAFTLTSVGEVGQGTLANPVAAGFSILSSKVPQTGALQTTLGFPPAQLDTVYKFVNTGVPGGGYQTFTFDNDLGGWDPAEPSVDVGEAVFVNSLAGHPWTRTFTVN
jgi:hypothetical protein